MNRATQIINWQVEPVSSKTINFTTAGIYRIQGVAGAEEQDLPFSLIIKIIQPEAVEKNDPQHHNYWKREALVYDSGLLKRIPNIIETPECYLVEEKSDKEIWLWMEEIKEDNQSKWSQETFSLIAKQMGLFHGAYATGEYLLPEEDWICKSWLKSWVDGCDKYAINPNDYYPMIQGLDEQVDYLWEAYVHLRQNISKHFQMLNNLPKVLSHQDLSQQNMYISTNNKGMQGLNLIDWQYLSIAGIGEDLGKLFGVAMSQEDIPIEIAWETQSELFEKYMEGLKLSGWDGNSLLSRYGFIISTALRSSWEVPKLIKLLANQTKNKKDYHDAIHKLTQIVDIQMRFAEEADIIMVDLNFELTGKKN